MECQTIETNYGECRCCMTKGNHRDIAKEYYYNGIREVFQDLFEECFNLHMVTNSHLSTLICSTCVSRLRDASNFKMMVVSTEKQLMETISKNEDKHTVIVNAKNTTELVELEPLVKVETVKAETSDSEHEISYESDAIVCGEILFFNHFHAFTLSHKTHKIKNEYHKSVCNILIIKLLTLFKVHLAILRWFFNELRRFLKLFYSHTIFKNTAI
ncbi:hypothetical protein O3G_MSEX011232 [Manduca sexta]|uniref:ZAD domain-containing protein n=1 Tax=Manduca sexta TaxID=7130 RepID=A0A921ZKR4_MANSE|nr:hypothetical protein O3G_MSEX011232 [Manduca sexta]